MSFMIYDILLLVIFAILIAWFLYKKKHNLKKEGLLLLYKTSWGIKLIDRVGNKYQRTLKVLSYVSVFLGYILMVGVLYLTYTILKLYLFFPEVVTQIKVPPIMPLIPYIDKVVPFLPPFYFTYWIVILAIIAISHEFAHGIFAAYNKVKIKKTGFGFFPFFLPVFLAAFVELDEKAMVKKKNFGQRAILSAGTFANVITAIVFLLILVLFFTLAFSSSGVVFDDYSYTVVNVSSITAVNGVYLNNATMEKLSELTQNSSRNEIKVGETNFVGVKGFSSNNLIALYDDTPAIENNLTGAILEINGVKVKSIEELGTELDKYFPGDEIEVKTKTSTGEKIQKITLSDNNPTQQGKPWLGIAFIKRESNGIMGKIFASISSFKKPNTYYDSQLGDFGWFIYYLLWWLILISISVALVNMLPMGIFDGGRFFYLTILSLGGSEKLARNIFKWVTYFFLLILFIIMASWVLNIFF
jgi:membrane-associated protease RseP (regulator of RpoE activity)